VHVTPIPVEEPGQQSTDSPAGPNNAADSDNAAAPDSTAVHRPALSADDTSTTALTIVDSKAN